MAAFEENCILCRRPFRSHDLDRDPLCDECIRKPQDKQEGIFRANMLGGGPDERLGPRAAIPHKVGGQWIGGGIDTPLGRQRWEQAAYQWKRDYGIENPWAQRGRILRNILEEDNPDAL